LKETGVEWIGSIPDDWEVRKLRFLVSLRSDKKKYFSGQRYIGLENIESYTGRLIDKETEIDEGLMDTFEEGNLLFSKLRPYLAKAFIAENKGFCTSELLIFEQYKIHPKLLFYIVLSDGFLGSVNSATYGTKMPRANWEYIRNIHLPFSSIEEQKAIADFLDNKVGKIDNAIGLLEQKIVKIEKYKKSLITEVVTKGINNNNSKWKVERLKYYFTTCKGLSITRENLESDGIPVISYGQIHSKYGVRVNPQTDDLPFVNESYLKLKSSLLNHGDFIFADTSEDIVGSGNFSTNFGDGKFFAGYHTIIVRLIDKLNNDFRYFMYLFDSEWFRKKIQSRVSGVKVFSITQLILKDTEIIIPTMAEQREIADFLEGNIPKIDRAIEASKVEICKLKEIRKSLIFEYVTGKKRVDLEE